MTYITFCNYCSDSRFWCFSMDTFHGVHCQSDTRMSILVIYGLLFMIEAHIIYVRSTTILIALYHPWCTLVNLFWSDIPNITVRDNLYSWTEFSRVLSRLRSNNSLACVRRIRFFRHPSMQTWGVLEKGATHLSPNVCQMGALQDRIHFCQLDV